MRKNYFCICMLYYTDQLGNTLQLKERPKRIISLVPSQSEFLWDLGLRDELVGITKFCIHPKEMYRAVERIGGTKTLYIERIRELKPDLIIANKEENEKSQIELLQKEFNVWVSDIYNFEDAIGMMNSLGEIIGKREKSEQIADQLKSTLPRIKNMFQKQRVAYFIWNKPYMCAAQHTFIGLVLQHIGLENALEGFERYPELTEEKLRELSPDLCFLSSEPFPFKDSHANELQRILPNSKILIVDGEMFSWYGSRLLQLEDYLKGLSL